MSRYIKVYSATPDTWALYLKINAGLCNKKVPIFYLMSLNFDARGISDLPLVASPRNHAFFFVMSFGVAFVSSFGSTFSFGLWRMGQANDVGGKVMLLIEENV